MSINEIMKNCDSNLSKALDHLNSNLKKLRTGRATTEVLDDIKIDYYGTATPVAQTSQVQISDGSTLSVKPFERKILGDIEKAILKANLGFSVTNDGVTVRVQIPPLNEERRKGLVAEAKEYCEDSRVRARDARRDANKALDGLLKDKEASEDEIKKAKDDVDGKLKGCEKKIDATLKEKSDEIMAF